ncbi:ArsR family transcriptional regulator [Streptomyces abyssalis]|uniref:ArsR family transcriptional regulator n=1 Tax=Streptomyces abyssalis TaxID=933944 RepID=A0A1E7JM68_9ACTN|nr:metalloregulator ArsR/SmtB family transcription factor [Streptomyces abyssalis]OEU88718.1 ArsR family transcriptional regulator [Streptomyces abyssalis]OEU89452.1 ArsR family transcriptional regulator [Streptomyces abyssalis]OEV13962.1 ArsR family transcriptional regulator [Streptomyces nanshensis]
MPGSAGQSGGPGGQDEQRGTRNRVARSILDHGPSTAAELALRLELTQAAVRRHLDSLVGDGVVEPHEKRVYGSRGRGRPAKVFALTDCGRDAFDQDYDKLAADALRWIAQSAGGGESGDAAVADFARARVAAQAEQYRRALERVPPEERTRALAEALTKDGYAATARSAPASAGAPAGEQLCQHHCPVAHTAEQFPQLCEAETEVFSRLLGTHVQRLATIAHGDGVCTTFVPRSLPASSAGGHRGGSPSQPRNVTETSSTTTGRPAGEAPSKTSKNASKTDKSKTKASNATTAPANTAGRNPA